MSQKTQRAAYIYAGIAIVLWASTPAVGKLLLRDLTNEEILLFSSCFAAIALFMMILWQRKLGVLLSYRPDDYRYFAGVGFVGVFLYQILFYQGLELSSAQEAFIMNYTWPLWIVIMAVPILKEKLTIRKMVSAVIGLAGVFVVASRGHPFRFESGHWPGNLLALAGAFCFGLFCVINKKRNYEKFTAMFCCFLFTFVLILICPLFFPLRPVNLRELSGLLWLGIFPGGLSFAFWSLAMERGDTSTMANLVLLTPFISLIYVYVLLGEKIRISSLIGLTLVAAGILTQATKKAIETGSS